VSYAKVGGSSWREWRVITLVIIYRKRSLARRLTVPQKHCGEVADFCATSSTAMTCTSG